jgi:hypothetical protein
MVGFPDIPFAPGIPAIPRAPGAIGAVVELLLTDALSLFSGLGSPTWGLFLDGQAVVTAESVISFEFQKTARISDFQVEEGGFESYNKVQRPREVRLRFSTGGSPADRQALLESAEAAMASLDLMDAVSPEAIYQSVNPVHMDYRRTAQNGVGLLTVDIFCEEVRVLSSSTFTTNTNSTAANASTAGSTAASSSTGTTFSDRFTGTAAIVSPQSPSAASPLNGGVVQPVTASPGQFNLSDALP